MLSFDEHSGVVTFMLGIIVLVMVGIGLSLMVDKRLKFSSGTGAAQAQMRMQAAELAELKAYQEERSAFLVQVSARRLNAVDTHRSLQGSAQTCRQELSNLVEKRNQLKQSIVSLTENFTRYRVLYRKNTWAAAVGEKWETLAVRGGSGFQNVVVTRITEVGVEIRHEHGIARIQAPDLSQTLQDRFQWNDEERRKRLSQEADNLREVSGSEDTADAGDSGLQKDPRGRSSDRPVTSVASPRNEAAEIKRDQVAALREQVSAWRSRISRLQGEKSAADSQAGYGSQTSVPGSLETWKAKSSRLGRELVTARSELSVAKARLSGVSPSDPLLRDPVRER